MNYNIIDRMVKKNSNKKLPLTGEDGQGRLVTINEEYTVKGEHCYTVTTISSVDKIRKRYFYADGRVEEKSE